MTRRDKAISEVYREIAVPSSRYADSPELQIKFARALLDKGYEIMTYQVHNTLVTLRKLGRLTALRKKKEAK